MIKYLQKLRSTRGFTIVELVVVVAIIGIMSSALIVGLDDRQKRIDSYQSTAQDFYGALQTEFTRFQMFDGPLTMTLSKVYTNSTMISELSSNPKYGGIKYFPQAKGNYPFHQDDTISSTTQQAGDRPYDCSIYIEARSVGGVLKYIRYGETLDELVSQSDGSSTNTSKSEFCAVLFEEMKDRMEYQSGYYYAKVSYDAPEKGINDASKPSTGEYRRNGVIVDWTAYTKDALNIEKSDYNLFGSRNQVLKSGSICGVYTSSSNGSIGTAGSALE